MVTPAIEFVLAVPVLPVLPVLRPQIPLLLITIWLCYSVGFPVPPAVSLVFAGCGVCFEALHLKDCLLQ